MPFQRQSETVTLWWSRLSFPHLFEPKPVMQQGRQIGEPRYSVLLVVADAMVPIVQQIEERLIAASWPEGPPVQVKRALQPGNLVRQGDPNLANATVLSANAKLDSPPQVVVPSPQDPNHFIPITDRTLIYSGAEAHVSVGLYTTQMSLQTPQINVGLNIVQPTGRAFPRFDNRQTADQAFAAPPEGAPAPPPAPDGSPPMMPGAQPGAPTQPAPGQPQGQPPIGTDY